MKRKLGWGLPFMNFAAFNGEDPFEAKLVNLRALVGGMSMNYFHFFVGADTPFKDIDEIFGQKKKIRIAISPAGTSEEWVFRKVLATTRPTTRRWKVRESLFSWKLLAQAQQYKDRTWMRFSRSLPFQEQPFWKHRSAANSGSWISQTASESLEKFGITEAKFARHLSQGANTQDVVTATSGSVITTNKDMPEELATGYHGGHDISIAFTRFTRA